MDWLEILKRLIKEHNRRTPDSTVHIDEDDDRRTLAVKTSRGTILVLHQMKDEAGERDEAAYKICATLFSVGSVTLTVAP